MRCIPDEKLEELEEARVKLYKLLDSLNIEFDLETVIKFQNITEVIWKVANTKNWDKE